ncbi:hypothetical protein BLA29_012385 [Euroglyphus maynei]|uniref:Uncharacterized protein n=1 Tax=Euroglyphus maynei TaxID=6958 RepID=A0A1Y3BFV4_EURMA|nr:hypothetical protein BLA29_012385 [Euroglyphus maynei]
MLILILLFQITRYAKQKQRLDVHYHRKKQQNDNDDDDDKLKNGIKNETIAKSHMINNDLVEMRIDDHPDHHHDIITTTFSSQQQQQQRRNRNEPPNFDIFAKQSVV